MKNFILPAAAAIMICTAALSTDKTDIKASMLYFSGAGTMEELSESQAELYQDLIQHPVDINGKGLQSLCDKGLLTRFQAASITDHIRRLGPIRSLAALSALDGFTPEFVRLLSPFIRINDIPAYAGKSAPTCDAASRVFVKASSDTPADCSWSSKAKVCREGVWSISAGAKSPYGSHLNPDQWSASGAYYGKRYLRRIVLGDFNATFSQGLCAWSGFSMSKPTSAASFDRRPGGISPVSSYNGETAFRGAGAVVGGKRLETSAAIFTDHGCSRTPGLLADIRHYGRRSEIGLTYRGTVAEGAAFSAGGRTMISKFKLWGETALRCAGDSARMEAVAGASFTPGSGQCCSFMVRSSPTTAFVGVMSHGLDCVGYVSRPDSRAIIKYSHSFDRPWTVTGRLSLRNQSAGEPRIEARSELLWKPEPLSVKLRTDYVHQSAGAVLSYMEIGAAAPKLHFYGRFCIFDIGDWTDRIYVYERDVPGSFNCPAYYGQGWSGSIYGGWKGRHHRLYLRMAATYCRDRADKAEIRLQYSYSL